MSLLMRSSRPQVFCEKGVLRIFSKFTRKHLCQGLFFNKVAGAACNFIKKEALAQVFSCEFWENSKNTFFYRTPLVAAFYLWIFKKFCTVYFRKLSEDQRIPTNIDINETTTNWKIWSKWISLRFICKNCVSYLGTTMKLWTFGVYFTMKSFSFSSVIDKKKVVWWKAFPFILDTTVWYF